MLPNTPGGQTEQRAKLDLAALREAAEHSIGVNAAELRGRWVSLRHLDGVKVWVSSI
jgi:hypothetical protein